MRESYPARMISRLERLSESARCASFVAAAVNGEADDVRYFVRLSYLHEHVERIVKSVAVLRSQLDDALSIAPDRIPRIADNRADAMNSESATKAN